MTASLAGTSSWGERRLPTLAGEPGHAARDQQRGPERLARREAGVARGRRREAADLELEARVGAKEKDPERTDRGERDQHADVDPIAGEELRNLCRLEEGDRL